MAIGSPLPTAGCLLPTFSESDKEEQRHGKGQQEPGCASYYLPGFGVGTNRAQHNEKAGKGNADYHDVEDNVSFHGSGILITR